MRTVDKLFADLAKQDFVEIVPNISMAKLPDRRTIKVIAQCMGIWDRLAEDLGAAKTQSRYRTAPRRIVTAAQSADVSPFLAWLILSAKYTAGILEWCDGVLLVTEDPNLETQGQQIATSVAKTFLA